MSSRARIVVVSDRIHDGRRANDVEQTARATLSSFGFECSEARVIPEEHEDISRELDQALAAGVRVIVTCGGTGVGPGNMVPEETLRRIEVRMHGLETQVLLEGLKSTPRAGLSRGVVGLTSRNGEAALIVNAPGSTGGVNDVLRVVLPLVDAIFEKFD